MRLLHREKRDREGRELETLRHGLLTTPHYYHLDMGEDGREETEVKERRGGVMQGGEERIGE